MLSSIRSKLFVLVGLALVPAALSLAVAARGERDQAVRDAGKRLLHSSLLLAGEHENFVDGTELLLKAMRGNPALRNPDACADHLREALTASKRYVNFLVFDAEGRLVCDALETSGSLNIQDRPYFQEAITGRFVVGDYTLTRTGRGPVLPLAIDLLDARGRPSHVLVTGLHLEWLQDYEARLALPPGAGLLVFDRRGCILVGGRPGTRPAWWPEVRFTDGTAMIDVEGQRFRIASVDDGRLYVAVGLPRRDIEAAGQSHLRAALLGLVATLLAGLVLSALFADRAIVRRVEALTRFAEAARAGRAGGPPLTRGNDEIGRLGAALAHMVRELERRIVQITASEATQRRLAEQDMLIPDLLNRRAFVERLDARMAAPRGGDTLTALLLIDLDRFKPINDTYGHGVGDKLLMAVGERLRCAVRVGDPVARLGGDEFAIILGGLRHADNTETVATKIVHDLQRPFDIDGLTLEIGASMGIALCSHDADTSEQVLQFADAALYRAKTSGRGRRQFFDADMRVEVEKRRCVEADLRRALDAGQFVLHYQPQVCLKTGEVVGVEALLRWQHPEMGLLGPAAFLPVAEASGLILPIGARILRMGIAQARAWLDHGLPFGRVAINVANEQFFDDGLVRDLEETLAVFDVPPEMIEIEVTENVFLNRGEERIADMLASLRRRGIQVALDDFGTGYASLKHLRCLSFDRIKLDRGFVQGIGVDVDSAGIVRTILGLGAMLGRDVVVEGIETEDQADFVRRHGGKIAQGYLFARPLPADDAAAFIEARAGVRPREKCRGRSRGTVELGENASSRVLRDRPVNTPMKVNHR